MGMAQAHAAHTYFCASKAVFFLDAQSVETASAPCLSGNCPGLLPFSQWLVLHRQQASKAALASQLSLQQTPEP